ncbi:MAG: fla cluster protein flaF [Halovenus sp.]
MGFSVSGAAAIIFIGLLISAATLVPAVQDAADAREAGMDAREERLLEQQNTAIEMIDAVYYTNGTLVVRVENTGTTSLDANVTDLLVDGIYADPTTAIDGDTERTLWTPGTELRFEYAIGTSPERVAVVTERGIQAATSVEEVSA